MAEKKIFNKRKNKGKKRDNTPTAVDRLDKEILEQVSVLLSVNPNIENKTLRQLYGISENQADYIRKHQKKWDIVDKSNFNKGGIK